MSKAVWHVSRAHWPGSIPQTMGSAGKHTLRNRHGKLQHNLATFRQSCRIVHQKFGSPTLKLVCMRTHAHTTIPSPPLQEQTRLKMLLILPKVYHAEPKVWTSHGISMETNLHAHIKRFLRKLVGELGFALTYSPVHFFSLHLLFAGTEWGMTLDHLVDEAPQTPPIGAQCVPLIVDDLWSFGFDRGKI